MIKCSNLPYVIFRPHNIYGPRMGTKHVIPQLIKRMYQVTNEIKFTHPIIQDLFAILKTL